MLTEKFVSTWSLVVELEDLAANSTDPEVKTFAETALKQYKFPVQSMVFLPTGEFVHGVNANELLDSTNLFSSFASGFDDPLTTAYHTFLTHAVTKADELKRNS